MKFKVKTKTGLVRKDKHIPWASGHKRARIVLWSNRMDEILKRSDKNTMGRISQRAFDRLMNKVEKIDNSVLDSSVYLKPWEKNTAMCTEEREATNV